MVIRKGEPWGTVVPRPASLAIARSDRELASLVAQQRDVPLAVAGGDLHRTLGRPTGAAAGDPEVRRITVDLLHCELDGTELLAVAHLVARRAGPFGWWHGPLCAVGNAQHLGSWDVGPSGHPNDGRAEVVEVDAAMGIRQRFAAWRRLPSGGHLPHPAIRVAHRAMVEWRFARPLAIYVDGQRRGSARHVRVTVEPDAYALHV